MKQLRREAIKSFYKINYKTTPRVARKNGLRSLTPKGTRTKEVKGKSITYEVVLKATNPLRLFVKEYLIKHKNNEK